MITIFDVGANDGSWGIEMATKFPEYKVFGFEPTPELVAHIREASKHLTNYEIVPYAVSDVPGKIKFNVAALGGGGCSSMLEFSDNLDENWSWTHHFKVTDVIEVDCIRLDQFCKERGITEIKFLHVDTQGVDLKVLNSLGEYLPKVKEGEIETAAARRIALYKDQHCMEDVVVFFRENGLEITRIEPNDSGNCEFNVTFEQKPVDAK